MKKVMVIKTHSFVDLITNSSSELFVCNGDKSIEAVKEIVNQIFVEGLDTEHLDEWDKEEAERYQGTTPEKIWSEIFSSKITVADRDFDLRSYPDAKVLKHSELIFRDSYRDNWQERHETIEKRTLKLGKEPFANLPHEKQKEKKEWILWSKKYNEIAKKVQKEFSARTEESRKKVIEYFNLPEDMEWLLYWDISVKKGDMLLTSECDNTVPYVYWDKINEMLNATNYHLG